MNQSISNPNGEYYKMGYPSMNCFKSKSPRLFSIYLNKLLDLDINRNIIAFVNDIVLFIESNN